MGPPCLIYVSTSNEAVFCLQAKKNPHTGVLTACHYLTSLCVCVSVCVCVTFVVFSYCESCTRSISTKPGSLAACEHGLTRGTRFVPRDLEVVAVAKLIWISWCVSGAAVFISCFFFFVFSFL